MDKSHTTNAAGDQTQLHVHGVVLSEHYSIDKRRRRITRTVRHSGESYSSHVRLLKGAPREDLHSAYDWCWLRQPASSPSSEPRGTIRIADLFSGCGQISLGIIEAARALNMNAQVVLAADSDPAATMMCKRLFPLAHILDQKIELVLGGLVGARPSPDELALRSRSGRVDILVGGPPCQGHSDLNNKSRRRDIRNSLGFRMVRAAEILAPRHVIIENVPGIRHDRGRVFYRIRDGLQRLGYHVQTGVLRAETIGVAQRRHRAFIVATKSHLGSDVDLLGVKEVGSPRTFQWACGDLGNTEDEFMSRHPCPKPQNRQRISFLFANDLYDLPLSERPLCHQTGTNYTSSYGRIHPNLPSQTITTNFQSIGTGRFIHPLFPRPLTLREAARLQYIPDFVDFAGVTTTTAARLIGNAVPPKLSYALALRLLAYG